MNPQRQDGYPDCAFLIVVGQTDPDGPRARQHSTIVVPTDTPGVRISRELRYLGGRNISEYDSVQHAIAHSRIELEQARLMVQKTAWLLDREGFHAARREVSMIKVAVAQTYHRIADRALHIFGAMGGSDDSPIAASFAWARAFRIGDGPDEVHLRQIYRMEEQPDFSIADSPHILPPH